MNILFRAFVFMGITLSLVACGSLATSTPSTPLPSATITSVPPTPTGTPTSTQLSNPTAIVIVEPPATQGFIPPTLVPTIDPGLVPEKLSKALSLQTMEGVNGHRIRKITGWDYGYGGGIWWTSCPGFEWLDDTRVLLYPAAGQVNGPEGSWAGVNTVPQPVVIDLESGATWQPPVKRLEYPASCNDVYWSPKLGLLITSRLENDLSNVTTYKSDGRKVADYLGSLWDVSPSRTKIMIAEDTLVDLGTNTRTRFSWPRFQEEEPWYGDYFWSYPDEAQVYHCCSYSADLSGGKSFRFIVNRDFQFLEVQTAEDYFSNDFRLPYMNGEWVRNGTFFLVHWSIVDDGDIRYLPMFNPREKIIYDVRQEAWISEDLSCPETTVSTNGNYVWLECYGINFLINLNTFETKEYPDLQNQEIGWSADEQFAWLQSYDSQNETKQYHLLPLASKKLKPVPIKAASFSWHDLWWHPTENTLAYLAEDGRKLGLVDALTIAVREKDLPIPFKEFYWSPTGETIVLVAEDGSVWQMDYPAMENIEQLTPPVSAVKDITWSPDGSSLSFVGGPDIYIVDTQK